MLISRGDNGASLRRHQYKVLLRIINPIMSNIIYVVPTGLSKFISFMLPASLSGGGMFVLVEPTRALQDNIAGRLRAASISMYAWRPEVNSIRGKAIFTRVVVITPKSFCFSSFSVFVAR